jgi:hypothetical protein
MNRSSGSTSARATDIRDTVGFAMREIYLGSVDARGEFHDEIQHGKERQSQTIIHVSSTDPWHRVGDLDEGVEQPGFDRIYQSGLTNSLPVLLPTGVLFDTPENAANEIRYLRARGFRFDRVELGEEPEDIYAPEDFGALYPMGAQSRGRSRSKDRRPQLSGDPARRRTAGQATGKQRLARSFSAVPWRARASKGLFLFFL